MAQPSESRMRSLIRSRTSAGICWQVRPETNSAILRVWTFVVIMEMRIIRPYWLAIEGRRPSGNARAGPEPMINSRAQPCDEAAIRATAAAGHCAATVKPWVLAVTILASSIAYIDQSVVNVALPAIETDLATSIVVIQWLINAYTLCLSAFLLAGGSAGDLFGR